MLRNHDVTLIGFVNSPSTHTLASIVTYFSMFVMEIAYCLLTHNIALITMGRVMKNNIGMVYCSGDVAVLII